MQQRIVTRHKPKKDDLVVSIRLGTALIRSMLPYRRVAQQKGLLHYDQPGDAVMVGLLKQGLLAEIVANVHMHRSMIGRERMEDMLNALLAVVLTREFARPLRQLALKGVTITLTIMPTREIAPDEVESASDYSWVVDIRGPTIPRCSGTL